MGLFSLLSNQYYSLVWDFRMDLTICGIVEESKGHESLKLSQVE